MNLVEDYAKGNLQIAGFMGLKDLSTFHGSHWKSQI